VDDKKLLEELNKYEIPSPLVKTLKKKLAKTATLESRNKNLGDLLQLVSHDTRNNLTSPLGLIDMFLEEFTPNIIEAIKQAEEKEGKSPQKPFAQEIIPALHLMKKSGIDAVNTIEMGNYINFGEKGMSLAQEKMPLRPTIHRILEDNFSYMTEKEADIFICPSLQNVSFNTSYAPLKTIIGNLIGNARKYSLEKTKLRGRFSLDNKKRLKVELENRIKEEMQFSEAELYKIFEENYRKGDTSDLHGESKGFGLYVIRRILEEGFKGNILAKSDHVVRIKKDSKDKEYNFGLSLKYDVGELTHTPLFYVKAVIPELVKH
jgi:signal transduction histidine kinase